MLTCKICGDKTKVGFNINLELVPICQNCATAIFLQEAKWLAEQSKEKTPTKKTGN